MSIENNTIPGPSEGPLQQAAYASILAYFHERGQSPGPNHRNAIAQVLDTLERMANGQARPVVYVSAMDPGCGKTTCLVHFAKALVASPDHRAAGMIVFVGRVAEAEAMAREMTRQGIGHAVAVWTADDAANALSGAQSHDKAQILIVTQQRVDRMLSRSRLFADVAQLHYLGRPRMVRAWDEAYLPGLHVAIGDEAILGVLQHLPRRMTDLKAALRRFADDLTAAGHNEPIAIPDFQKHVDQPLQDLADSIPRATRAADVLRGLALVGGTLGRVSKQDGKMGTLVSYGDTRPDDFAPVIVLDASARVRHTYRDMEAHRGNIVMLESATKDYGPLTVHIRHTSATRDALEDRDTRQALAQDMAALIRSRPDEQWLIVTHLPRKPSANLADALRPLLPGITVKDGTAKSGPAEGEGGATVHIITYGNHMATNLYRDFPNVILAGVMCAPAPAHRALTHLAQDRNVADGFCSDHDLSQTHRGEYAHNILQALCRGRVRKLDGDNCQPMNAYIIAAQQTGIAKLLPVTFPGCAIKDWGERKRPVSPSVGKAIAYLEAQHDLGAVVMTYSDLQAVTGVKSSTFAAQITSKPAWLEALERLGWERAPGQRARAFIRNVSLNGSLEGRKVAA
ncbi:hypothetical protein [Acidocella aromatica]|uniref:Uncharacterized protein n=1 Tax=Acidocella aromatica TaxID=1303579 RepID=A0A840V8J6_9PROT|nr:hypothetical protein [Acidocella aromatica]MBB5372278.1 hypothetical protein [Acidocella aromatica]